ncbi:MAG: roadblock/LC7 domain-containing protein [Actinobacteria bacterium]|nr:roadblock/LC7 domain-containing protein [Actinomycetota bacterium]
MSKADRLAAVLDSFLGVSAEAEAAAVVSADGLPMASALPPHVEEDRLAAMSAALLTLGERAAEGLGRGDLGQVFVEGADGYVVLMAAGPHAVLVVITSKRAKIGLALFEMRRAAAQISDVMAESVELPMQTAEPAPVSPAEAVINTTMGEAAPTPPPAAPEERAPESSEAPFATWQ